MWIQYRTFNRSLIYLDLLLILLVFCFGVHAICPESDRSRERGGEEEEERKRIENDDKGNGNKKKKKEKEKRTEKNGSV